MVEKSGTRGRQRIRILRTLAAALAVLLMSPALLPADEWPSRPVRMIVPFGAGGSGDAIARVLAEQLAPAFGQQFVIENRTGAGGAIGAKAIATAPPDGYTIGITNLSILSLVPVINPGVGYDPSSDFSHIAYVADAPIVLAANPQTGVSSLDEFVRYATERKAFTFASSGVGSDGHLMGEAIAASLKLAAEHVPYKSTSQALVDVVGGHVPFCTFTLSSTAPFVRDGTLTAIAVTAGERLQDFPHLPTFRERGRPELQGTTWFSVSGPAGLPRGIIDRLNWEINRIVTLPDIESRLRRDGFRVKPLAPSAFADFVIAENRRWLDLVRRAGLVGKGG
jgi:tripartite-type tricarboxylate transporter receptor subunit TctC